MGAYAAQFLKSRQGHLSRQLYLGILQCLVTHGGASMSIQSCGLGHNGGPPLDKELYSPRETEHLLSVSHATLYRLINAGRLDARKIDGKTVIIAASIEAFVAALPKIGEAA